MTKTRVGVRTTDFRPDLVLYCDGSTAPNPGPGGWGVAVFAADDHARLLGGVSGGTQSQATTNNRMELEALTQALQVVARYSESEVGGLDVEIRTDSIYVLGRLTARLRAWEVNDDMRTRLARAWTQATKTGANVSVCWVKGHSGEAGNDRADTLAATGRNQ